MVAGDWGFQGVQMKISYLREFVDLTETLSFVLTARRFYLAPSTLSRHIAALEKAIDANLFERDRHSVELTSVGEAFAADARAIVELYDKAIERIHTLKVQEQVLIRIGYLPDIVGTLPGMVHTWFSRMHPEATLKFHSMEYDRLFFGLGNGELDAALIVDVDPDLERNYETARLVESCYMLASPKDGQLAGEGPCSASDLEGAKIVLPDPQSFPALHRRVLRALDSIGVEYEVVALYADVPTLFFTLDVLDACALVLSHHSDFYSGDYSFREIAGLQMTQHICAAWSRQAQPRLGGMLSDVFGSMSDSI